MSQTIFVVPNESRHWKAYSNEELAFIESNYKTKTDKYLGRKLKREPNAISALRSKRGWIKYPRKSHANPKRHKKIPTPPASKKRKVGLFRRFINFIF